jgi:hypothetical protein
MRAAQDVQKGPSLSALPVRRVRQFLSVLCVSQMSVAEALLLLCAGTPAGGVHIPLGTPAAVC